MRKQNRFLMLEKAVVFLSFFAFAFLTAVILNPIGASNAEEVVYDIDSKYTVSMAVDETVSIPITPTPEQKVYTGSSKISYTNTCPAGFSVKISTNSDSNDLVRTGDDTLIKNIPSISTGTQLTDNTWGYLINNSENAFSQVPVKQAPVVLFETSEANETAKEYEVTYGVKVDSDIPSGAYSTDVLYTIVANPGCFSYDLEWDLDGGTPNKDAEYPKMLNYNTKVDLKVLQPERDGYVFAGWDNGENTFRGIEDVDINENRNATVKMTAKWDLDTCVADEDTITETLDLNVGDVKDITYSSKKNHCFTLAKAGYYKIEAWGAQGGTVSYESRTETGGFGGYAVGVIKMDASQILYAVVGGQGGSNSAGVGVQRIGGYNGGGNNTRLEWGVGGTGGGATHFALKPGVLKSLEKYKGELSEDKSYYISRKILMVAGGGAAGGVEQGGTRSYHGAHGGGYIGNTKNHVSYPEGGNFAGGNQTTSTFGGSCNDTSWRGAAGGGWFCHGGGGSGYIGSSNLLSSSTVTKHMTCYACATSNNDATRTISNTRSSSTATADVSKSSNGYAKITYLGTEI